MEHQHNYIIKHGNLIVGKQKAVSRCHAIDQYVNREAMNGREITRLYLRATKIK